MRQNPGNAGPPHHQDEVTVRLPPGTLPAARDPLADDGVTVMVPGAILAPAPTPQVIRAGEAPVFVDDSGTRKRLLRLAGVLIALLSIGFLAIVGVALAVPNVATSVGLGSVIPFIVPGAAALPPQLAPPPPPPRVQVAQPKPKPAPAVVAAPTIKPEPVAVDPTTTLAPATATAVATDPTATQAPTATATQAPATTQAQPSGGTPVHGGQVPVNANPTLRQQSTTS